MSTRYVDSMSTGGQETEVNRFHVVIASRRGRRIAVAGLAFGLLFLGGWPSSAAAQTITCFIGGEPGGPVPMCYPDPHDPGRTEVRPDRAALYCNFWNASGTILP